MTHLKGMPKNHVWGPSKRTDDLYHIYEECVYCPAERFSGKWHYLKRPNRHGVSRKWREPGPIFGPRWCIGGDA